MDGNRFDNLTIALAGGASRRRLLKILAGGGAGGLAALIGRQQAGAFICRNRGVLCAKDAHCCSDNCVDYRCACPSGQTECGDGCIDTTTDPTNCGGCDFACTVPDHATPTCDGGNCGFTCKPDFWRCDERCIAGNCCDENDCLSGQTCENHQCEDICALDCAGKECGDDGCGGSCGTCSKDERCIEGQCAPKSCVPDCHRKQCGDDGCGGSCGTCARDQTCVEGQCGASICIPDCAGKECGDPDGCGGGCIVGTGCFPSTDPGN